MTEENKEFSFADAEAQARAEVFEIEPVKVEAKEEVAEPEVKEEAAEAVVEETTEEAESEEVEAEHEEEPEEEEKPKERSKYIPRKRFDDVNEKLRETESEAEKLRRELAEARDLIRSALKKEEKKEEAFEPLDPEAYEATKKNVEEAIKPIEQELREMKFAGAMARDDAEWSKRDPEYTKKIEAVVHADVAGVIAHAQALGYDVTEKQAFELVREQMRDAAINIYNKGGSYGAYIVKRAEALGVVTKPAKPAKPAASKVNVKELEALRQSAGAPTNKSASNPSARGLSWTSIEDTARKELERDRA